MNYSVTTKSRYLNSSEIYEVLRIFDRDSTWITLKDIGVIKKERNGGGRGGEK